MPDTTDPSLTHTVTTREAGEGVRQTQRFVPSKEWLLRMAEKEDGCCISAGGWVARVQAAERAEAELDNLRSRLARDEAIETAADKLLDYFAGMSLQSNYLLGLIDQLKAARKPTEDAKEEPTLKPYSSSDPCPECSSSRWTPNVFCATCGQQPGIVANVAAWDQVEDIEGELGRETEKATWLVEESTVYTLDETGQNRIYANFRGQNNAQSITYRERCELARRCAAALNAAPTPTEAEVERLRREVDERDSTIAELHCSLDAARLDAKRLERVLADRRSKLDALVAAVDKMAHNPTVIATNVAPGWTGVVQSKFDRIRLAADAARDPKPTEAR